MVSTTKQTMYPSPFLLTCFYAPGNWRSCAKMWHRLFWPKDTDWSCSNSMLGVPMCVHLCPYTTGASLGETDPNVNMKPNNAFPGSTVRQKMEAKSISCYFLSARWLCRQWDIFFCLCPLIITLLTSVQFCQLVSAEMWPSACLQFIRAIHHSGNCRQCVLWGNQLQCTHTYLPFVKTYTLQIISAFQQHKVQNSVPDHCGVTCFNEKKVQEFGSTEIS